MSNYTLELFRLFLERDTMGLPTELKTRGETECKRFEQQESMPEQVEAMMIKYGLEAWPYVQADFAFHEKYGKEKQEKLMVEKLDSELQKKWEGFAAGGGSMSDYHHGDKFEKFFTPEENMVIKEALMEARDEVKKELLGIALSEKRDEYDQLIDQFKQEQEQILEKMEEFKKLKKAGDKWDAEIDEVVYYFRKGFAELEERPTIEKIQEKVDWYTGQIERGNT